MPVRPQHIRCDQVPHDEAELGHMGLSTESIGHALAFILQGIPALSPDATDFIRKRPRETRLAIAVALEAAAARHTLGSSRGVLDQLRWHVAHRNADLTWGFLTREWEFEDETTPHLDLLKTGCIDEVIDTAATCRAEL